MAGRPGEGVFVIVIFPPHLSLQDIFPLMGKLVVLLSGYTLTYILPLEVFGKSHNKIPRLYTGEFCF